MITAKMILEQDCISSGIFVVEYPFSESTSKILWDEVAGMNISEYNIIDKRSKNWDERYRLKVDIVCEKSISYGDDFITIRISRFSLDGKFFAIAVTQNQNNDVDFVVVDNKIYKKANEFIQGMLENMFVSGQNFVNLDDDITDILGECVLFENPEFKLLSKDGIVSLEVEEEKL